MVRRLVQRSPFVAIEKVTAPLAAVDRKVTEENSPAAKTAKVIVWDEVEVKTTVPVPGPQFADVLLFVHDPPNVHVALPILKYAAALEMDVSPAMPTMEGAPEPSRTAAPERVSPPFAVRPVAADAPIVMVPPAWTIEPLTAKSNTPMAMIPAHPVVLSEDIAAFRSTATVPPPEFASKKTELEAFGAEQPFTPPDEDDQCVVWDQLPVPPIQYRLPAPQGAETVTSTTGSEPSMVRTT
jgi:hypothetical protein